MSAVFASTNRSDRRSESGLAIGQFALVGVTAILMLQASNAWVWLGDSQSGGAGGSRVGNEIFQAVTLSTNFCLAVLLLLGRRRLVLLDVLLLTICVMLVVATAFNAEGAAELAKPVNILLFAMAVLELRNVAQDAALRAIGGLLFAIMICSVAISFSQFGRMEGIHAGLWRGLFEHKNRFGQFCGVTILFAVLARRSGWLSWPGFIAILGVSCPAFVMTGSVTALAFLLATAVFCSGFALLAPVRIAVPVKCLTAALILVGVGLMSWLLLADLADMAGRDGSLSGRTKVWAFFSTYIGEKPWIGWGVQTDAFKTIVLPAARNALWPTIGTAHNGLLQIAFEGGLVTAAVFALYLVLLLFRTLYDYFARHDARSAFALQAVIFLTLSMLTESINGFTVSLLLLLFPLLHRATDLRSGTAVR